MKRLMLLLFCILVAMLLAVSCNRLEKEYYSPFTTHAHPAITIQPTKDNNEDNLEDENERTVLTPLMPLR